MVPQSLYFPDPGAKLILETRIEMKEQVELDDPNSASRTLGPERLSHQLSLGAICNSLIAPTPF